MPPALFHSVWGSGCPTIAIHGLGASSAYWDQLAQVIPSRRVVAMDLLGFGRSPAPDDSRYDLDAQLEAIEPLLAIPAIVCAHSTGCLVALGAAARWPQLVRGLVLTGLPVWPDRSTAMVEVGRIGAMARWTVNGDFRGRLICETMCRHRSLAAALAPLAVRSVPAGVAIDGVRHSWTSYKRTLTNLVLAELGGDLLASVTCPTAVIVGAEDRVTRPHWVREALVRHPSMRLDVLPGVDHHPALRAPDVVAAAIAAIEAEAGGGSWTPGVGSC